MTRTDELIDHIIEIKATLAANTVTLNQNTADVAHHIKRTDLLERRVAAVELPIKSAKWVGAFVVGLATVLGAVYGFLEFVGVKLTK